MPIINSLILTEFIKSIISIQEVIQFPYIDAIDDLISLLKNHNVTLSKISKIDMVKHNNCLARQINYAITLTIHPWKIHF